MSTTTSRLWAEPLLAGADWRVDAVLRRGQRTQPARVVGAGGVVEVVEVEPEPGVMDQAQPAAERALGRVGQVAPAAVGLLAAGRVAHRQEQPAAVLARPQQRERPVRGLEAAEAGVADRAVFTTRIYRQLPAVGDRLQTGVDHGAGVVREVLRHTAGHGRLRVAGEQLRAAAAPVAPALLPLPRPVAVQRHDALPEVGELEQRLHSLQSAIRWRD